MSDALELRLVSLARKVAEMYKDRIEFPDYEKLCNAITVCEEYYTDRKCGWEKMYEAVEADDGIWEYALCSSWDEEEIRDMWMLETNILSCNCYLGNENGLPEDLELRGERIPAFVGLLETSIDGRIDYDRIFKFWDEEVCY